MLGLEPRAVHEQAVCPELQPPLCCFKTTVLCPHPDLVDQSFGGGAQECVLRLTQDCACVKQVVGMEWAARWLVVSHVHEFPGPPALQGLKVTNLNGMEEWASS